MYIDTRFSLCWLQLIDIFIRCWSNTPTSMQCCCLCHRSSRANTRASVRSALISSTSWPHTMSPMTSSTVSMLCVRYAGILSYVQSGVRLLVFMLNLKNDESALDFLTFTYLYSMCTWKYVYSHRLLVRVSAHPLVDQERPGLRQFRERHRQVSSHVDHRTGIYVYFTILWFPRSLVSVCTAFIAWSRVQWASVCESLTVCAIYKGYPFFLLFSKPAYDLLQ